MSSFQHIHGLLFSRERENKKPAKMLAYSTQIGHWIGAVVLLLSCVGITLLSFHDLEFISTSQGQTILTGGHAVMT